MIAPDCVVVRDSPAIGNDGVERRALDCKPLRAELARLAERVDREIGRGAVGIGMREPAGDLALAASGLKDRVPGRGLDRVVSKRSHVIEVSNQAPLSNPTSCQPLSALPKADHP